MFYKYLIAVAFFAMNLGGCVFTETACTDIAVSSSSVMLVNEQGDPVAGADVRFSADGVAEQMCQEFEAGTYVCGFEIPGQLQITIAAEGFEPAEVTVDVDQDECHVITQEVSVTLTTAAQPA